ncbi:MAG: DUF167 domain-containing protein [Elusimicrobia bacterium]|nr:DUF167 domain-containing protein [Elusimicrobiota bacterium]
MPTLVRVKVHPDSRQDRVERVSPTHYEVWVKAKPEAGRANAAALGLVAAALGVKPKRLRIAKGALSPNKIVEVLGS